MGYITEQDYIGITGAAPPQDFSQLAAEADRLIDNLTLLGLCGRDVDQMPEPIRDRIKAAAAHQVQYMDQRGGLAVLNDSSTQSMTLGKFGYSGEAEGGGLESPLLSADLAVVGAYLRGLSREANT